MSAEDHLSGYQFKDVPGHPISGDHQIATYHQGELVGHMQFAHYGPKPVLVPHEGGWREMPGNEHPQDGRILGISVDEGHRRKGVATGMLNYARTINPRVHHNTELTHEGRAWAKARP